MRALILAVLLLVPAHVLRPAAPTWSACAQDPSVECATVTVPVDWDAAYGAKVRIAVARRPAADPARRIGTLFVNPGGPGGSGVDFAVDSASFFSAELRDRFDIVGFDPRGVSRSRPIVCRTTLLTAAPPILIDSAAAYSAMVAYNRALAADCAKRTGPLYGHADTLSVVRDLDAIRAMLGERKISFYGASYGTLVGAQYAERYPGRVRALVLDSVMDHSVDTDGFLGGEAATAQDSFDEFVAWCDRSTECGVHGRNVRKLWGALLAAAKAGTLEDPYAPTYKLDLYELVNVAFGSLYAPQWHSLGIFIREATAGLSSRRPRPEIVDVSEHSFPAVFCDDWSFPLTGYADLRKRLDRIARRSPQMPFSPLAVSSVSGCLGWAGSIDNPQRPLKPLRTPPVLLINARHDPATAYAWARNVTAQLGPKATLLTYEGWGHTVYGRTPCMDAAVDRYLVTVRPPAEDPHCPGAEPVAGGIG